LTFGEGARKNTDILLCAVAVAVAHRYSNIFQHEKPEYNATNAYFGCIPLLGYVFLRNLTPALRSTYAHSLHELGKVKALNRPSRDGSGSCFLRPPRMNPYLTPLKHALLVR
jgi:hypothetical protein